MVKIVPIWAHFRRRYNGLKPQNFKSTFAWSPLLFRKPYNVTNYSLAEYFMNFTYLLVGSSHNFLVVLRGSQSFLFEWCLDAVPRNNHRFTVLRSLVQPTAVFLTHISQQAYSCYRQ